MKHTQLFVIALGAALCAAPTFAQQQDEPKAPEAKTHEEAKPAAHQERNDKDEHRPDANDNKIPQSNKEPGVRNPEAARPQGQHDATRATRSDQEPAARQPENNREASHGATGKHAEYHFKGDEKSRLRGSYRNINSVNRTRRATITREEVIPVSERTYIEPVPVGVVSYLPPPPEGYMFGYVDGYCVVYDPSTFLVIEVIDLL